MTLQQFIANWSGKFIPSRGGIVGQCVSMVQKWAEDNGVTGTPVFPVAAAKDMPGARKDFFDWIPNTPTGVPQPGDIIVWGSQVGQYGHTAIFIDGNAQSFRSFDQNWPVGSAAHIQAHNYTGVLGWLRLKKPNQGGSMANIDGSIESRDSMRVINSEVKGWNFEATHKGEYDAREIAAWSGRPWTQHILQAWAEGTNFRQARNQKMRDYDILAKQVQELSARPTKAELEAITSQLKASADKVAELEKQVKENPDTVLLDQSGGWLKQLWARLFGGK